MCMSNPGQESPDNKTLHELNSNVIALTKSLEKSAHVSGRHSVTVIGFSFVLLVVAVMQLITSIYSLNQPILITVILTLACSWLVMHTLKTVFALIDEKYKD